MQHKIGIASRMALVLAILAGIGFGARQAFAEETAFSCHFNPPSELGACNTTPECNNLCVGTYQGSQGNCVNLCCFCEL
jgi:hypothetical protein